MEKFQIKCPICGDMIYVPFTRELTAQAIEKADLAEMSARDQLRVNQSWLSSVSLLGLLRFWLRRRKVDGKKNT